MNILNKTKVKISTMATILLLISFLSGMISKILLIYLTIFLHELGHLIAILIFKGKINSINFNLFGGRIDAFLDNIKDTKKLLLIDMARPSL